MHLHTYMQCCIQMISFECTSLRAVTLNPDYGDAWAYWYKLETQHGTEDTRKQVIHRCCEVICPLHVYVYVYVCMFVCMYVRMSSYMHIIMNIYGRYTHAHTCTHTNTHTHTHTHTHTGESPPR